MVIQDLGIVFFHFYMIFGPAGALLGKHHWGTILVPVPMLLIFLAVGAYVRLWSWTIFVNFFISFLFWIGLFLLLFLASTGIFSRLITQYQLFFQRLRNNQKKSNATDSFLKKVFLLLLESFLQEEMIAEISFLKQRMESNKIPALKIYLRLLQEIIETLWSTLTEIPFDNLMLRLNDAIAKLMTKF